MARESGMDLLVYQNPEAKARGINPFDHGAPHRHVEDRRAQAGARLYGFDAPLAARAATRKRAAPRSASSLPHRQPRLGPKNQRPELWNLYNARKNKGDRSASSRSATGPSWTSGNTSQRRADRAALFCRERPTVERDGMLLMVDDDRFPLKPGESPVMRSIRFRTLGCYPLTGAVESTANCPK
jgi:sulfate adenylyltransferase subunit 2